MTRETKVGLLVACSFLCLVGVVVASKLRGGNAQGADGEPQEIKVAAAKDTQNSEKKDLVPAPPKNAKDAVVVSPMPKKEEKKPNDAFPPIGSFNAGDVPFQIPSLPKSAEPKNDLLAQNTPPLAPPSENKGGVTFPPVGVPPPVEKKDGGIQIPPTENKSSVTFPPIGAPPPVEKKDGGFQFPPAENKSSVTFPPIGVPPPVEKKDGGLQFPPIENKGLAPIGMPPVEKKDGGLQFPPIESKAPAFIEPKGGGVSFPPLEKKDGGGVTFPPIGRKDGPPGIQPPNALDPKIIAPNSLVVDGDKNQGNVGQISGVQPIPAAPLEEKKGGLVFPPIVNKPDNTPPPIGEPGKKPFGIEPPPTVPPFVENTPPPMVTPQKDPPRITDTIPIAPPFNPTPKGPNPTIPSGQTNPLDLPSTPPIGVTPINIGSKPILKETQPDSYFARAGETNFNALSARIYQDERYAGALLAYNRRYRAILRNGENFALDPPIIREGQEILYPNRGILERDFGNLIAGLSGPTPTIPLGNGGINIARPAPITAPNISAVSNPPTGPSGRTYVVQNPNGESILDIAERALGSRSRWNDIYNLNAGVQPQFRIPVGTQLKLP